MQMPLEEFTKNAGERNPAVNWVLRFSSSVGSLTIGCHKNTQFEGRRGKFCENWGSQAYWRGWGVDTKRGGGFVSRTESNFFQGLEWPNTLRLLLLLVNSLRTEIPLLSWPSYMEKGLSPNCFQQFRVLHHLLADSSPPYFPFKPF